MLPYLGTSLARTERPLSSLAVQPGTSRYSKINWLTCLVLVVFHVLAITALFQFTWTNLFVAAFLYWVAVGLGISMGYPATPSRVQDAPFPGFLALCGCWRSRRTHLTGSASPPSTFRPAGRPAYTARERVLVTPGLGDLR